MTDNEIIRGLGYCIAFLKDSHACKSCPYYGKNWCREDLKRDTLFLIRDMQAEIERLKRELAKVANATTKCPICKTDAVYTAVYCHRCGTEYTLCENIL